MGEGGIAEQMPLQRRKALNQLQFSPVQSVLRRLCLELCLWTRMVTTRVSKCQPHVPHPAMHSTGHSTGQLCGVLPRVIEHATSNMPTQHRIQRCLRVLQRTNESGNHLSDIRLVARDLDWS